MLRPLLCSALALASLDLSAAATGQAPSRASPAAGECSTISPVAQRRCVGRRVETKDRLVRNLYLQALASVRAGMAKWGRHDSRLDPRHFAEAHRDWLRFIASNCRAVGAIGGGSNSFVSDRITDCYERELDERIQLYRRIAEGTYGT
ncbi:MAG TPA: hypothetical protein VIL42_04425 [Sphingomicrobium sp.]|jgi:uncharacterized protein YecT (DUF1311 family)